MYELWKKESTMFEDIVGRIMFQLMNQSVTPNHFNGVRLFRPMATDSCRGDAVLLPGNAMKCSPLPGSATSINQVQAFSTGWCVYALLTRNVRYCLICGDGRYTGYRRKKHFLPYRTECIGATLQAEHEVGLTTP